MILKLLKADGLAQHTYFIGSEDEAAVIDPRREAGDVADILDLARRECMRIRYVLETHRNEDFVHGSLEIAGRTGATIYHGSATPFKYGKPIKEGDEVSIGSLKIKVLETPGHTPDSLTYVLYDTDHPEVPLAAFDGDELFVGSTGRIDLPGTDIKRENAIKQYESIHEKILPLGDQTLLCPAHGAGSVCGSGMADRDWSTVGYEKKTNPFLQLDKDKYVEAKVNEKMVRPPYFMAMEQYNLDGPPSLASRIAPAGMSLGEYKDRVENKDYALVDTRMPPAFGGGHIPGSYNIWLGGMALFPGWMFGPEQKLLLLTDRESDAATADKYLCRIGYDHVEGYLCGGFQVWQNAGLTIGHTGELSAEALRQMLQKGEIMLLDVREPREWEQGIVEGAKLIYVGKLKDKLDEVPRGKPIASMCSVGHRGSLGASILQKAGFRDVYNVLGGFTAWKNDKYPTVKPSNV
jgi:hydroxyacylglutathione hydrolase